MLLSKAMRFVYSLLYTCALLAAFPYFLIVGLIKGKYLSTIAERFGNIQCRSNQPSIWIHAVSVGEFLACKSLIKKVQQDLPEFPIFLSTTTITAQKLAKQLLPGSTFYFPFDWSRVIRKVLSKIRPKVVLVLETEIWPNFLWTLQDEKIPAVLLNGRISDRSFRRYQRVKKWLPGFTESWMQTEEDSRRMQMLGMHNVSVMGNLKYDFHPQKPAFELSNLIQSWKKNHMLWIAGSTMAGEEEMIFEAFVNLKQNFPLKLLIAPRHPERFLEVENLAKSTGLSFAKRSWGKVEEAEILILDSIGELASVYDFAEVVLIGGSLKAPGGGHNPIEPAFFGKPIVSGPFVSNMRAIYEDFEKRHAVVITSDIFEIMKQLLANGDKRVQMGEAARKIVEENAGASEKAMRILRRFLTEKCLV